MDFDVIIPTYKVSPEFITRCLDSVVNQTVETWHCWIADGTPQTHESYGPMMEAMAPFLDSEKFTYLRQSGKGVSQARNEAVSKGSAPYLATLDGDDLWYPEHLEWVVEAIELSKDTPVALWWAGADAEIFLSSFKTQETFSTGGVIGWFEQFPKTLPRDTHYFLRGSAVIPSNTVVIRNRFEEVGGYDETLQIGEDTDLYLRMTGDPGVIGYENTYWGYQIDAVSGYHGCGEWQTTQCGVMSSVADNRNFDETMAELQRQAQIGLDSLRPVLMEDKPPDVSEEYWNFIVKLVVQKYQSELMVSLGGDV